MPDRGIAAFVLLKDLGDLFRHQRRADREIGRGDALGHRHQVGLHAPVARSAPVSGASEAADHLVRDHQDAVAGADLAHQFHEAGIGHQHAAGAQDRLHDEGGDGVGALEFDLVHQFGRDLLRQPGRVGFVIGVAIGVGRGDVETAGQKRFIPDAEAVVAVHAGPAEMRAVIALFQRQELGPLRLALDAVIIPRQPQTCVDGIRSARGEEDPADAVFGKELLHRDRGLDRRGVGRSGEGRIIGQLRQLVRDRLFHHIVRIAQVGAPQPAHAVDHRMAVDVEDARSFGFRDDGRRVRHAVAGGAHGMPQGLCIMFLEEIVVLHGSPPCCGGRLRPSREVSSGQMTQGRSAGAAPCVRGCPRCRSPADPLSTPAPQTKTPCRLGQGVP